MSTFILNAPPLHRASSQSPSRTFPSGVAHSKARVSLPCIGSGISVYASGLPSAWFICAFRDTPGPSLLPCLRVVVAVSGSIVYIRATISLVALVSRSQWPISHALGFFFTRLLSVHSLFLVCRLLPRCRVGRQLLSRHAVLQLLVLYASPVLLFFPLRRTRTFFILCAFQLSMRTFVFLVCVALIGVPPFFTGCHVYRPPSRS